jgi:outer membrane protein assembly factor BamB
VGNGGALPIAADRFVYFVVEDGRTIVIKPGEELEIVAESKLPCSDEEIFRASPTPSNGQLFIRSTKVLYAVGKATK